MKVATWNVNGIRARSSEVAHWIDGEVPDVICLQETKAPLDKVPEPLNVLAGYHAHWHGSGGYSGVALLLREQTFPEPPQFVHPPFDLENRIVVAEVGSIVFGSVYIPNGGKDFAAKMVFLRELEAWAGALEASGKHLVLCGDFNVARTEKDVHPVLRKDMVEPTFDATTFTKNRERLLAHDVAGEFFRAGAASTSRSMARSSRHGHRSRASRRRTRRTTTPRRRTTRATPR